MYEVKRSCAAFKNILNTFKYKIYFKKRTFVIVSFHGGDVSQLSSEQKHTYSISDYMSVTSLITEMPLRASLQIKA